MLKRFQPSLTIKLSNNLYIGGIRFGWDNTVLALTPPTGHYMDFILQLFNTEGFPLRWLCGTAWRPFVGWFMIASDLMIFSAYLSIPLLLVYFIRKKQDMAFLRIFWLFAAFIFACGVSHLLDAMMFWWPVYRLNALERFITGLISWGTVLALVPIIPQALALRSPAALEKEVNERRRAEESLTRLNEDLEKIIAERTREVNEKALLLETANRELEAFSYSVSHDLKAPLRKIEQFSEMIKAHETDGLDEKLKTYLERISANAVEMSALIEDMLGFSRLANAEMKREPVDLSRIAQDIAQDLQMEATDRSVTFVIQPGLTTEGDPTLLRAVLQNLLGNAWKYCSKNQAATIEFAQTTVQSGRCYFIKDNGVGFDMAGASRLFKPFQRLHLKSEFPGSGIGLANVQRIVSRHGGRVWAEGKPGEGATFYFTLPNAEDARNALLARDKHTI